METIEVINIPANEDLSIRLLSTIQQSKKVYDRNYLMQLEDSIQCINDYITTCSIERYKEIAKRVLPGDEIRIKYMFEGTLGETKRQIDSEYFRIQTLCQIEEI